MTKRFEETYGEMGLFRVKDNKTGKCYVAVLCGNPFTETDEPILDILNEIAEENEQLKSELDGKIVGMNVFNAENTTLMEENEQLEQELDYWKKKALLLERKEMSKQYNETIR